MPNRWPIANGNWSDSAIWSGSLIPTALDDVYLNNRTVTLDQDVNVITFRNAASASAITANGILAVTGSYTVSTTNGFIFPNGSAGGIIQFVGTGSLNLNGNITPDNSTAIYNYSTGTINIVGNIIIGNSTGTRIINSQPGTINLVGNITMPGTTNSNIFALNNLSTGTINITGNVTAGGTGTNNVALINTSVGTINITGNVTAGTGATTANGVQNSSIGTINITGNVAASSSVGISSTTAGIINVIGQLQASSLANAVTSTSTTATNVFSGPFINSGSRNAIYCYNVRLYDDNTTRYTIGVSGSTNTISLLSPDQVTGVPSGSNVRAGISFGPGNELTGSMQVPNPQSVSISVAVDNTVGTVIAKPEDLWNYAVTSLTASNSIGQRLASTATSASNAAIVSSFSI